MTTKEKKAKNVMLPHSKAKVELYQRYLERYLNILLRSNYINQINIFDVFCGRGIYEDGGHGSPIQAFDTIVRVRQQTNSSKRICLYLNDKKEEYVENVKEYIDSHNIDKKVCDVVYSNHDAEKLLVFLSSKLKGTAKDTRNLIFIDPYGYKEIHKNILDALMSNGYTEILLFLPISFMHRFRQYAFEEDCNEGAKTLRKFIESFFPESHPVCQQEDMDVKTYIEYLTSAFSYKKKYYTTSYHIERDKNRYFALFFFSSHILGFQKILEVKWELDKEEGNGFKLPTDQPGLFDEIEKEDRSKENYERLKRYLVSYLKEPKTNLDVYEYVLRREYLPTHANSVLRELQNNNKILVTDLGTLKPARKGAFYLSNQHNDSPKVIIYLSKK